MRFAPRRRLALLVLVFALIIGLAAPAAGQDDGSTPAPTPTPESTPVPTAEPTAEPTPEPSPVPETDATPDPTPEPTAVPTADPSGEAAPAPPTPEVVPESDAAVDPEDEAPEVDETPILVDQFGNPVLDEEGNPIDPRSFVEGEEPGLVPCGLDSEPVPTEGTPELEAERELGSASAQDGEAPAPAPAPAPETPAAPAPAAPEPTPAPQQECIDPARLAAVLASYEAAAAEEIEILEELRASVDNLQAHKDALEITDERLAAATQRLLRAWAESALADQRRESAAANLVIVEAELAAEREVLQGQAVEAYIRGGIQSADIAGAILGSSNAEEIEAARQYGGAALESQQTTVVTVEGLELRAIEVAAEVADAEAEVDAKAAIAVGLEADVVELRDAQLLLIADAEAEIEIQAALLDDARNLRIGYANELGVASSDGSSVAVTLAAVQENQVPLDEQLKIQTLSNPLPGEPIASTFGPRNHPILGYVRQHNGLDLGAPFGMPILAAADGEIVLASDQGGFGNVVVIDHGHGVGTVYAHQSSIELTVGQVVERGDVIGFVGSTGLSTGPHLHFEVREFGQPVDPMIFLDFEGNGDCHTGAGLCAIDNVT